MNTCTITIAGHMDIRGFFSRKRSSTGSIRDPDTCTQEASGETESSSHAADEQHHPPEKKQHHGLQVRRGGCTSLSFPTRKNGKASIPG